ncbi:DUF692 domain-containing protein [Microvirga terrae]|uniref:UPF0276 protein HPT29_010530 n=1 Tax=Microvirga terrae TaxID=2740529 RepID=A0ABY5RZ01_9HYPH|nr:DUF692 domain-containing protein [Microvirga terrae]UVF21516.1 DUF692 domain-containing protein [Microvirga terrae]
MTAPASRTPSSLGVLPARAGLGLKPRHYGEILQALPPVGFFEVHAENYMGDGGPPHRYLERIRAHYPLSVHGVGLSIGGDQPLDKTHLARLRRLIERYEPESFSEHLAWSTHDTVFLNDLLPVPYDGPTLRRVCEHVDEVQETLGRRMLLENPSTYIAFEQSDMSEIDFLREIACRAGCGLLLDVNNVFVSATNHAYDATAYLDAFPVEYVGEIHLAGFVEDQGDTGDRLLIDAHGTPVADIVWRLFELTLRRTGPVATLIEWDNDVPAFPTLMTEARKADRALVTERYRRRAVLEFT